MSEPVIRRPLRCIQCGYDLEGLSARGACPECGREIVASLASNLDLIATDRAPAPDARRVAWALFLATAGALAGSARLPEFAASAAATELAATTARGLPLLLNKTAAALHIVGFAGAATGLIALTFVLPRRDERRVLRIRVLGCVGFALWLALSVATPNAVSLTATALPVGMVLLALSPLLRELGPRSRVYRDRETAKQRIDELLLALGIAGVASVCAGRPSARFDPCPTISSDFPSLSAQRTAASTSLALRGFIVPVIAWRPVGDLSPDLRSSFPVKRGRGTMRSMWRGRAMRAPARTIDRARRCVVRYRSRKRACGAA